MKGVEFILSEFKEDRMSYQTLISMVGADLATEALENIAANDERITSWIEQNISARALYKGVEYFRKTENGSPADAMILLELDLHTLRLSKYYVASMNAARLEYELQSKIKE